MRLLSFLSLLVVSSIPVAKSSEAERIAYIDDARRIVRNIVGNEYVLKGPPADFFEKLDSYSHDQVYDMMIRTIQLYLDVKPMMYRWFCKDYTLEPMPEYCNKKIMQFDFKAPSHQPGMMVIQSISYDLSDPKGVEAFRQRVGKMKLDKTSAAHWIRFYMKRRLLDLLTHRLMILHSQGEPEVPEDVTLEEAIKRFKRTDSIALEGIQRIENLMIMPLLKEKYSGIALEPAKVQGQDDQRVTITETLAHCGFFLDKVERNRQGSAKGVDWYKLAALFMVELNGKYTTFSMTLNEVVKIEQAQAALKQESPDELAKKIVLLQRVNETLQHRLKAAQSLNEENTGHLLRAEASIEKAKYEQQTQIEGLKKEVLRITEEAQKQVAASEKQLKAARIQNEKDRAQAKKEAEAFRQQLEELRRDNLSLTASVKAYMEQVNAMKQQSVEAPQNELAMLRRGNLQLQEDREAVESKLAAAKVRISQLTRDLSAKAEFALKIMEKDSAHDRDKRDLQMQVRLARLELKKLQDELPNMKAQIEQEKDELLRQLKSKDEQLDSLQTDNQLSLVNHNIRVIDLEQKIQELEDENAALKAKQVPETNGHVEELEALKAQVATLEETIDSLNFTVNLMSKPQQKSIIVTNESGESADIDINEAGALLGYAYKQGVFDHLMKQDKSE